MSRTISASALAGMYSQEDTGVWSMLVEMSASGMSTLRFVNNYEDVSVGGDTYTAYPFTVALPQDHPDQPPEVTLTIDNVDRTLVDEIRTIAAPIDVDLSMYYSISGDVEAGPYSFKLRSTEMNAQQITARLSFEHFLDEPFPAQSFTPALFPGIFGGVPSAGADWIPTRKKAPAPPPVKPKAWGRWRRHSRRRIR